MGKNMDKLIVIGVILVLIIIVVLAVLIKSKKSDDISDDGNDTKYSKELLQLVMKDRTYDKLSQIVYSNSGNSNGNVDRYILNVNEKKLTTEYKDYYTEPLHIKEYSVTDADIQLILDDIEEYNFPEWKSLPSNDDEIALDASSVSISFVYDNSASRGHAVEYYTLNFQLDMPEDGREALRDFINIILELNREQYKLKEYDKAGE